MSSLLVIKKRTCDLDVAQITPLKKYNEVAESNIESNKVGVDPMRNRLNFYQELVYVTGNLVNKKRGL